MRKAKFYHHWTYLGLWLIHHHREGVRMPSFQKGFKDGNSAIRNYIWFVPPRNVKLWSIGNKLGYQWRLFRFAVWEKYKIRITF
jgi:hypothetical protein